MHLCSINDARALFQIPEGHQESFETETGETCCKKRKALSLQDIFQSAKTLGRGGNKDITQHMTQ